MGLTRLAVNMAAKMKKIENYENYLFIGPHPDDIEIGCGATIAKLSKMGKRITFLICTDGRYGHENVKDISTENLISIRKEECLKSAKALGDIKCIFLGLEDGNQYTYRELLEGIASVINNVKPDIVFAPDPDIISECHMDHLNVGRAAKELSNFSAYPEIFGTYLKDGESPNDGVSVNALALYFTNKANTYVKTTGYFKTQLKALFESHLSQYPKDHPASASLKLYLTLRSIEYGLKRFHLRGEGYRMMDRLRMHCLPEASK